MSNLQETKVSLSAKRFSGFKPPASRANMAQDCQGCLSRAVLGFHLWLSRALPGRNFALPWLCLRFAFGFAFALPSLFLFLSNGEAPLSYDLFVWTTGGSRKGCMKAPRPILTIVASLRVFWLVFPWFPMARCCRICVIEQNGK